jgi:hypothetical protein
MENKPKQTRFTLEDTLVYQGKLRKKIQELRFENRPLTNAERKDFYESLAKGLLGQGTADPANVILKQGWFTFSSVQNMALRIADIRTNEVILRTTRPEPVEIKVSIGDLWRLLYEKILYLFPQATAEAAHMSKENVEHPQQGEYVFSSEEALE